MHLLVEMTLQQNKELLKPKHEKREGGKTLILKHLLYGRLCFSDKTRFPLSNYE